VVLNPAELEAGRRQVERYTAYASDERRRLEMERGAVLGGPRIQSFIDGPWIRLREMSNFCCLPGRAGGTPIMV
jgi:hypothetical protein